MGFRSNYWSCTKFARWCQLAAGAPPKLDSGTSEEWRDWKKEYKTNHPRMYWFTETGLNAIQDFVNWPLDQAKEVRSYLRNRFVTRTHIAPSDLTKGQWHESNKRLMHTMFGILVQYVESECAYHALWCGTKDGLLEKEVPWYRKTQWFDWTPYRNRKHGLDYLDWEISLGEESPRQAEQAVKIKELYLWWMDIRPNRPDPYDASNFSTAYGINDGDDVMDFLSEPQDPEVRISRRAARIRLQKIEEQYEAEDTEMLIRLVQIRDSLWT